MQASSIAALSKDWLETELQSSLSAGRCGPTRTGASAGGHPSGHPGEPGRACRARCSAVPLAPACSATAHHAVLTSPLPPLPSLQTCWGCLARGSRACRWACLSSGGPAAAAARAVRGLRFSCSCGLPVWPAPTQRAACRGQLHAACNHPARGCSLAPMQVVWPAAAEVRLSLEGWGGGPSGRVKAVGREFLQEHYHRRAGRCKWGWGCARAGARFAAVDGPLLVAA